MFSTRFTTAQDFQSEWYKKWKANLDLPDGFVRKWWEIAYVMETLDSHGVIKKGCRGVGFGVGSESLTSQIADLGPKLTATDLCGQDWSHINSGFGGLSSHQRIETRVVDMNWIDGESGKATVENESYDFSYSICSMDHCGTVWWTKRFLLNQMNCLRVGGIATHTGEYTISLGLPRVGGTVWLDWADILDICNMLLQLGHEPAPIDWNIGNSVEDHQVDPHPHSGAIHLKPEVENGRWGTCVGFAVRKKCPGVFWIPLDEAEARNAIANCQFAHSQT